MDTDHASLEEVQKVIREELVSLCHAYPRSNDSSLSVDDVARTAKFLTSTFLQHYRLYSFVFRESQNHVEHTVDLQVGTFWYFVVVLSIQGSSSCL